MNIPTIDLAQTGANIVTLRKAAGLSVADVQMVFGFNSPQAIGLRCRRHYGDCSRMIRAALCPHYWTYYMYNVRCTNINI